MPLAAITTWGAAELLPVYNAEDAWCIPANLPTLVSYPKGTVLGELTASPGTYAAYASGNSDGTQTPKAISRWDCATDAAGQITIGSTTAGVAPYGLTQLSVDVYVQGVFKTSELTGLDSTALANANWHLLAGTVSDGVLDIG